MRISSRWRTTFSCRLDRDSAPERGAVFIELAITLPILFLLLGWTFRLTQLLYAGQIAALVSREAATAAFRQCADYTIGEVVCQNDNTSCVSLLETQQSITQCLQQVGAQYQAILAQLTPPGGANPAIQIEVYRNNIGNLNAGFGQITRCTSNGAACAPGLPPGLTQGDMVTRNRAVRGQVTFQLAAMVTFLPAVLNQAAINQLLQPVVIQDESIL